MGKKIDAGVIALVLGVLLLFLFIGGGNMFSGTPIVASGSQDLTTTTGNCPASGLTDLRVAAYNDLNANKAQVATKVSVFMKGDTSPTETITTSTSGYVSSTSDLPCGTDYTLVFGHTDESNYYETWVEGLNTGQSAAVMTKKAVQKVGSATILASNGTAFDQPNSISLTLGTGQDSSDITAKIKEDTADAYFGQGESLVCFDYDTSNFTSVEVVGAKKYATPTIASGYEKCWEVATPDLVNFGKDTFTVLINTKAGVDPNNGSTGATPIKMKVFDFQNFEYQGKKYWTVSDPADDSAIGATDVTYTINVY